MFLALIACSDCPEELEVTVADLDELDVLACDCGYGFVLLSVSEVETSDFAEVTPLRRPQPLRRAA